LDASSIFSVELAGTVPGLSYAQQAVTGTVNLGGAKLQPMLTFNPGASNQFVIISNDGVDPVVGTFAGLPEGATFATGNTVFKISYHGGDGNDVVLTQVSTITPIQLAISKLPAGNIQLTGAGIPGLNYLVQANTNLATTNWIQIATVPADQNGSVSFVDTNASNYSARFYRFISQ